MTFSQRFGTLNRGDRVKEMKDRNIFSLFLRSEGKRRRWDSSQGSKSRIKPRWVSHGSVSHPENQPCYLPVSKPHFQLSDSIRCMICIVSGEGPSFFHWCSVDMKDNGLQWLLIIAVENSLLGDNVISLGIPSSWLWFQILVWLVFGRSERKNLLSEFSVMLIWAPMVLKHFTSCQVYLSRSWYFSVVSAVWGLLHSYWKALPSLKLAF